MLCRTRRGLLLLAKDAEVFWWVSEKKTQAVLLLQINREWFSLKGAAGSTLSAAFRLLERRV